MWVHGARAHIHFLITSGELSDGLLDGLQQLSLLRETQEGSGIFSVDWLLVILLGFAILPLTWAWLIGGCSTEWMLFRGVSPECDTPLALKSYKSLSNDVDKPEAASGCPIIEL